MAAAEPLINDRREIFGWTMYDWAVSAFSTTVAVVFLGPYVTNIAEAAADAEGLLHLGRVPIRFDSLFAYAAAASVLLQVTFLPLLGALADYSHRRKQLLMLFSTLGAVATLLMFFIGPGGHWLATALFLVANVSMGASVVFYNAYLPSIASEERRDHVSAAGFGMGYLGGGILLLLNLLMFLFRENLGLDSAMVARLSLASAGVWWLGFSLITFRTLRARHAVRPLPPDANYVSIGFRQLATLMNVPTWVVTALLLLPLLIPVLFILGVPVVLALLPAVGPIGVLILFMVQKSRQLPEAVKYLCAYLLYNDGIQTVIAVAAIFAEQELEMGDTPRILVILMIQFVAFSGAYGFSFLARRLGTRNAILLSLAVWCAVVIYAWAGMKSTALALGMQQRHLEFWVLAFVVALVLGGSQALSRSLFAQMIPKDQEAEFFSFYEISERGTSWLGMFIFGVVNQAYGSLRLGILSVIVFFVAGILLLPFVNVAKAIQEGKQAKRGAPPAALGAAAAD